MRWVGGFSWPPRVQCFPGLLPDPARNNRGFSICHFQARALCILSFPVWTLLLLRNAWKCCCLWGWSVKSVKRRYKFCLVGPTRGLGGPGAHPCLGLAWDGGQGGVSMQPASGAETPGHVAKRTFTAHRKHLFPTGPLVLLCNYARLPDISGALVTRPARALLPDMTLALLGFLWNLPRLVVRPVIPGGPGSEGSSATWPWASRQVWLQTLPEASRLCPLLICQYYLMN